MNDSSQYFEALYHHNNDPWGYDLHWYEARKRAKNARDEAIKAYLKAKRIKATYMLDEYSDSEDEFDEYECL